MTLRIVAIALVTQSELDQLGTAFRRAYPIEDGPCFAGLLQAIDEADRELWRERDGEEQPRSAS
ncbi:MAG TPA: hypothetical protein VGW38_20115 [Chloroflexota bacterium]|nr:hypothetical protein [Chloroflexota bacterium]